MKRTSWLIAALALPTMALLAGCKSEAQVEQEAVRPVKIIVVDDAVSGHRLTYSGVVRPRIESSIGFRVAGKIIARFVNAGDHVEAGQTIARLDDADLQLAANSTRADVAAAKSRYKVASDNLERGKALLPRAVISQAAYDTRRNELDAAASALESAEAQLRQALNAVGYATLKADKAGTVTAVLAEPGQVVSAGQTVITLAQAGETEIAMAVPERDAGFLAIGQPADVTLWAGPQTDLKGQIREIAGQADPASRTYAVRIAVKGAPEILRLGMTATVSLQIEDEDEALVIPIMALTENEKGPLVFVVDPTTGTVRETAVRVAGVARGGVRITEGLQAGDKVVTAGVQFLRDGQRVRIADEPLHARL